MHSIQLRAFILLLLVFALVLAFSTHFSGKAERTLVESLMEARAKDTADFYFDSVNAMMLTGTMQQRSLIRKKVLLQPNILDARIIRAPAVVQTFGEGDPEQKPMDTLDHQALAGQRQLTIEEVEGERRLTLVEPMRAGKDVRGVNCLACHQVEEGTVLGAVRVSYTLGPLDKQVNANLLSAALVNSAIAMAGLLLVGYLMRKWLFERLRMLGEAFERIRQDADLAAQIPVHGHSEIDVLARHFNHMMNQFQQTMVKVTHSNGRLGEAASRLEKLATETGRAVEEEGLSLEQLVEEIAQVASLARQVEQQAADAAEASNVANEKANHAQGMAESTIEGIRSMHTQITDAASIIQSLDEHSKHVSQVLGVIKGIAEQTNLLALNAAIEAARAGEAGRGFAVVADEVRALARRTQESAGEIESMIASLVAETDKAVIGMEAASQQAGEGVQRTQAAIDALKDISQRVQQLNRNNQTVLSVSERQKSVTEQARAQLSELEQLMKVVHEDAEASSKLSELLLELYQKLEKDLGRFRY